MKFFKDKHKDKKDIPKVDINNIDQMQGRTQIEPKFVETKLDEEVVRILTGDGDIDRLSKISKQDKIILIKLGVKIDILYKNSLDGQIAGRKFYARFLNLSVSEEAFLLKQVVEISRPKIEDIQNPPRF